MINEKKKALLVGASGLVGSQLLNYLLNSPEYEVINVFVRTRLEITHPKLKQIVIHFDQIEDYIEYIDVNDVFCCLGTTIKKAGSQETFKRVDYEYPVKIAELAKKSEVQKFLIISALGADAKSKIFYNRVKGEVEERLMKEKLPSLHIFRPSLLLGERTEFRFVEKLSILLSPLYSLWMVGPLQKFRPIRAKDVAAAMYVVGQRGVKGTFIYESHEVLQVSKQITD
ncbi:NAD(P)H-binding protein [Bacillus sp. Marseille-P3661]|uniref:NAD(P)H-binding protein n=1 Tax=Bacillus sp. Marseille-P3661 TaxID=1936234 RepID=UPI000C84E289|nr:NAD(P)H-binding protein [Bacillus sp. Marseille-P3661]